MTEDSQPLSEPLNAALATLLIEYDLILFISHAVYVMIADEEGNGEMIGRKVGEFVLGSSIDD